MTLTTSRNYITTSVTSLLLPSRSHHWSVILSVAQTASLLLRSDTTESSKTWSFADAAFRCIWCSFSNTKKASICKWCVVRLTRMARMAPNSWISERPCLLRRSLGDWKTTGTWSEWSEKQNKHKETQRVYRCLQITLCECEPVWISFAITSCVQRTFLGQVPSPRCVSTFCRFVKAKHGSFESWNAWNLDAELDVELSASLETSNTWSLFTLPPWLSMLQIGRLKPSWLSTSNSVQNFFTHNWEVISVISARFGRKTVAERDFADGDSDSSDSSDDVRRSCFSTSFLRVRLHYGLCPHHDCSHTQNVM